MSNVDTYVDAFATKASTSYLKEIGSRMKEARKALGLTQEGLAALAGAKSKSGLQDNEAGKNMPGGQMIAAMVRAGINSNWLLTGEGPMMLSELSTMSRVSMLVAQRDELASRLQEALEKAWAAQVPQINVDAMVQAIAAIFQVAPKGDSIESLARKAVAFYQYCEQQGLITKDGQGSGVLKDSA